MKNFLKENWIKILIIVIIFMAISSIVSLYLSGTFQSSKTKINELTNEEMKTISKSIVMLECLYDDDDDGDWEDKVYGSGIYLSENSITGNNLTEEGFTYLDGYVLTNAHVAQLKKITREGWNFNFCDVMLNESIKNGDTWLGTIIGAGQFSYNEKTHFLDKNIDIVLLKYPEKLQNRPVEKPNMSDSILKSLLLKNYPVCASAKIIGEKVYVFGYPSSAFEYETLKQQRERYIENGWDTNILDKLSDDISVSKRNLIILDGIISGKDSNGDYYTTAKIDAGSSGGLAVSKINGEICIVGIPTWVSGGEYENLGMIQSFQKIKDVLVAFPLQ